MKPQGLSGTLSEGFCIYTKIMRLIPLSQGKFAQVDDEDFERVNQFKWCAWKDDSRFYAMRTALIDGKRRTILMHRFIMKCTDRNIQIDHRNTDGLNNQKSNMRKCTHQENCMNQRKIRKICSSKYKGVYWFKANSKWSVRIGIGGKTLCIGYFTIEEDAARAYDAFAIKHFGEFAVLNFPPP